MNATVFDRASIADAARPGAAAVLRAILRRIVAWHEASRQRAALARLSPEHLRDIGLMEEAEAVQAARAAAALPTDWR